MSKTERWVYVLPLGILAGWGIFTAGRNVYQRWNLENTLDGERIPSEGKLLNPLGRNPGNPENAIKDLRRMHVALVAFRAKRGRMPKSPWELLEAGKRGEVDLNEDDYINPDAIYADNETLQKEVKAGKAIPLNASYGFSWLASSPANTAHIASGKPTKWVGTLSYQRDNAKVYPGLKYEYKPEGYTLYLWSDGRITKELREKRRMVRDIDDSWRPLMEGESSDGREVISEAELYDRLQKNTLFSKG